MSLRYHIFDTGLGVLGIAWSGEGIARLLLPQRDVAAMEARLIAADGQRAAPQGAAADATERLVRYASGESVDFSDLDLHLAGTDTFRLAIYNAARRLAWGVTTTYGALAEAAGYAGRAQETGAALGANPTPILVPCHRIVAAGNRIGGFSAPGGAATKAKLLALEGVQIGPAGDRQSSFAF